MSLFNALSSAIYGSANPNGVQAGSNPFGDIIPTNKDYEIERERYISNCTESNNIPIVGGLFRTMTQAKCATAWENATQNTQNAIYQQNAKLLTDIQKKAINQNNPENLKTIAIIAIIFLTTYLLIKN